MTVEEVPVPMADAESERFFAALDAGYLELERCKTCGAIHIGQPVCDACGSTNFESVEASGRGEIYCFTRMHIAHNPAFADDVPYAAGIVELEEGVRLFARFLGDASFRVGMPVKLEMLRVGERNIPAFRGEEER